MSASLRHRFPDREQDVEPSAKRARNALRGRQLDWPSSFGIGDRRLGYASRFSEIGLADLEHLARNGHAVRHEPNRQRAQCFNLFRSQPLHNEAEYRPETISLSSDNIGSQLNA